MSDAAKADRATAEVLEDLLLQAELDEWREMTEKEQDAKLAAAGYDDARVKARVERGRERAAKSRGGNGKVIQLGGLRARRTWAWGGALAAAAAILLFVAGGKETLQAWLSPGPVPTIPTGRPTPPPEAMATVMKREALRSCEARYFGECADKLDELETISPGSKDDPDVVKTRKWIEDALASRPPGGTRRLDSKTGLAPGERPLQPLH